MTTPQIIFSAFAGFVVAYAALRLAIERTISKEAFRSLATAYVRVTFLFFGMGCLFLLPALTLSMYPILKSAGYYEAAATVKSWGPIPCLFLSIIPVAILIPLFQWIEKRLHAIQEKYHEQ